MVFGVAICCNALVRRPATIASSVMLGNETKPKLRMYKHKRVVEKEAPRAWKKRIHLLTGTEKEVTKPPGGLNFLASLLL